MTSPAPARLAPLHRGVGETTSPVERRGLDPVVADPRTAPEGRAGEIKIAGADGDHRQNRAAVAQIRRQVTGDRRQGAGDRGQITPVQAGWKVRGAR